MEAKRGERGKGHRQEPRKRAFVRVGNGSRGTTRGARVRRGSARPGRAGLWMGGECVPLDDGVRGHQSELLDLLGGVTRLLLPAEARLAVAPVPPSRLLARDVGLDGVLLRGVIAASSGGIVVPTGASFAPFAAAEDVHEPPLSSPPSARWEMTSSRDAVPAVPNVFPDSNPIGRRGARFWRLCGSNRHPNQRHRHPTRGGAGRGRLIARSRARWERRGETPPPRRSPRKRPAAPTAGGANLMALLTKAPAPKRAKPDPESAVPGDDHAGSTRAGGVEIRSRDPPARRGTLGDQTRAEVRGIPREIPPLDT